MKLCIQIALHQLTQVSSNSFAHYHLSSPTTLHNNARGSCRIEVSIFAHKWEMLSSAIPLSAITTSLENLAA